jgi:serine protease Do
VIGVNVAIYREAQNIGFAVPIARARALLERWLDPRNVGRRTIGFEPELKDHALVVPAQVVGAAVRPGDVIRAVGDRAVADLYDFHRALLAYPAGGEVPMTVGRGGQTEQVKVAMAALPKPEGASLARKLLGLEFGGAQEGARGGVRLSMGLAVSAVTEGGAAQKAGLRAGLWVTRVNDREIRSLDDVGLALESVKTGDAVNVGLLSLEESGSFLVAQSSVVPLKAE